MGRLYEVRFPGRRYGGGCYRNMLVYILAGRQQRGLARHAIPTSNCRDRSFVVDDRFRSQQGRTVRFRHCLFVAEPEPATIGSDRPV
jgi:hypothetical protein